MWRSPEQASGSEWCQRWCRPQQTQQRPAGGGLHWWVGVGEEGAVVGEEGVMELGMSYILHTAAGGVQWVGAEEGVGEGAVGVVMGRVMSCILHTAAVGGLQAASQPVNSHFPSMPSGFSRIGHHSLRQYLQMAGAWNDD